MEKDDLSTACLIDEAENKRLFAEHFDGCQCHTAFPDQLHTFVGDCSSDRQVVVLVPKGDVKFTSNKYKGMCIIAVVGESVSADYLEFLEDMQISYVFAGHDGKDMTEMKRRLKHDFGIDNLNDYRDKGKAA